MHCYENATRTRGGHYGTTTIIDGIDCCSLTRGEYDRNTSSVAREPPAARCLPRIRDGRGLPTPEADVQDLAALVSTKLLVPCIALVGLP